jgi:hypothetical protein
MEVSIGSYAFMDASGAYVSMQCGDFQCDASTRVSHRGRLGGVGRRICCVARHGSATGMFKLFQVACPRACHPSARRQWPLAVSSSLPGIGRCRPRACENSSAAQFRGSFTPWRGQENSSWSDPTRRRFAKRFARRVFTHSRPKGVVGTFRVERPVRTCRRSLAKQGLKGEPRR